MRTPNQLGTGPSRTEGGKARRFQPYGTHRAHRNEHVNAEAGPSTLVPLAIEPVGLPTVQPSGGESETVADANDKKDLEEDKVPVSSFYCAHIPRESD